MTILLDPPRWPAHGRAWSHLVSDTSLLELRLFARACGVPDRAFDVDHYDVPAERYDDLVAAGALAVDGGELSRRLAASGLRVPGRERRRTKAAALGERWASLWGGTTDGQIAGVGDDLFARWSEPHRVYHARLHLADTLDALDLLLNSPELSDRGAGMPAPRPDSSAARVAALALWFHDAVHDGATPADEEASATLVPDLLGPLAGSRGPTSDDGAGATLAALDVAEVARLVLLTAGHDPAPGDLTGALVSDADLAILGGEPARYRRYVAQVRAEYADVPDDAFRAGRAAVLQQLLALHAGPGLFRTAVGRARWAAQAEANLRGELARLIADQ